MKKRTFLILLKSQFTNPLMYCMLFVAALYLLSGHFIGGVIVCIIMMINVSIDFYQEYQNHKAIASLKLPDIEQESPENSTSTLIQGTLHLAYIVLFFVMVSLVLVFFINMFIERELSTWLEFVLFSAALAISAIPSSLRTVIIFCLTSGAMTLRKHKIVIRKLSVIENLAGIDMLCIDITGTSAAHTIFFDTQLSDENMAVIKRAHSLGIRIKIFSENSVESLHDTFTEIGLVSKKDRIISGSYLGKSSEEQKRLLIYTHSVFAQITPDQKYQIISYLQVEHCVAYISNQVHDKASLAIADVGIIQRDMADKIKEEPKVILLQRNLASVILCLEESRKILSNTLKYVKITVSSNLGNFYSLAFSSLLINYLPMLPLQLLFLNLIGNFPLIAIFHDSVDKNEVQKPLHLSARDVFITFLFGLISSPFAFMIFVLFKHHPGTLQTNWFVSSVLMQVALIMSLRIKTFFWKNQSPSLWLIFLSFFVVTIALVLPFTEMGQRIFLFVPPSSQDLLKIFSVVICYFITIEMIKLFYYRNKAEIA